MDSLGAIPQILYIFSDFLIKNHVAEAIDDLTSSTIYGNDT